MADDEEATSKSKSKGTTVFVPKTATDQQRLRVEKLMKNPDKEVKIPDLKKEWKPKAPPEFVRHVMGSSAGAGSGEFHVYRGIRRREFARQAWIEGQSEKQTEDELFHRKLEDNKAKADERTAKKRAKRLKKKQKFLAKKKQKKEKDKESGSGESEEDEPGSEDEEKKDDDAEENCFVIGGN